MKLANQVRYEEDKYTSVYERNLCKLLHINSIGYINFIQRLIANNFMYEHTGKEAKWALMFYYALYNAPIGKMGFSTIDEGLKMAERILSRIYLWAILSIVIAHPRGSIGNPSFI